MREIIMMLKKMVPDGVIELERRYEILKGIERLQPIGRRKLATELALPERILRSETEFLKDAGFILVSSAGMTITSEGTKLIDGLGDLMSQLNGMKELQHAVEEILSGVKVIVVAGDTDENENVKADIGKEAAKVLVSTLNDEDKIAITGGTTVSHMVGELKPISTKGPKDILVLPARGGLGTRMEYQANTLASSLAKKLNGGYQLLNVPDQLSRKALESVQNEPEINAYKASLSNVNRIVFGIGDATRMAARRKLSEQLTDFLHRKKAVAEAFGYYFNEEGEIIYRSRTIGISLEQIKGHNAIALAGGRSKGKAIYAIKKYLRGGYLIIDEGAAREILALHDRG